VSDSDLIPAHIRARLKELRLSARSAAGAHGLGQHSSRSRGAGLEFAQYRAYEPGDEPRRVDWKLYARSDRFFVRESERDSPLSVWLILDATASMAQSDAARAQYSKLDAAKSLAACLVELALRQGDRFGLIGLSGSGLKIVPSGAGARQRDRCVQELTQWKPEGSMPDENSLRLVWEQVAASSLVIFLSDGFDESLVDLSERLAAARREVLSLQLLTTEERDFPFSGGHRFVDGETGEERRIDAAPARPEFIARFAAARRQLSSRLAASGIRYVSYVLDEPLDAPLRKLFAVRGAEAHSA
jgi:uncharacterized protein (DUF58 family)